VIAALLTVFAVAGAPTGATAPARPQASVALTPKTVTVGDRVTAEVTLRVPKTLHAGPARFPTFGKTWGDAEIVQVSTVHVSEEQDQTVYRQQLVLVAFRTGHVPLPPVNLVVPQPSGSLTVSTPQELGIDIRSVIPPNAKDPKPQPPAPLRMLPLGAAFWWTVGALAALAIAGAWWLLRRRQPGAARARAPLAAPLPELLATLDQLDNIAADSTASLSLHTRLSHALRRYLGRALDLPARESTTTEIQRLLLLRSIPSTHSRRLIEVLRACDLVKFARQHVAPALGAERVATVRQLARELDTHLHPPAPIEQPERLEAAG
jgi:hypothetical protein